MHTSIDIVIPSFRAKKEHILPILELLRPQDAAVNFYLVIDNPEIELDKGIHTAAINDPAIHLIVNEKNLGASLTRNVGINSGTGQWILFLDDDITVQPDLLKIYNNAITNYSTEIGFIGLVTLPSVTTPFTKSIVANGTAGIFSVAKNKDYYTWGATANTMIKREAIGTIRFSSMYPKEGGGEDVDFFLRVRSANNYKSFKTLKEAEVWHPWWDNGKVDLKRAFRYGKGTGWLINQNPEYSRYDFLSTPETLVLSFICLLISIPFDTKLSGAIALFIIGILVIELIANFVNALRNKKNIMPLVLLYVILQKVYYDTGVLSVNLFNVRLKGICKRFNDNGSLKRTHFIRFNRYKITKFVLYTVLIVYLIHFYHTQTGA